MDYLPAQQPASLPVDAVDTASAVHGRLTFNRLVPPSRSRLCKSEYTHDASTCARTVDRVTALTSTRPIGGQSVTSEAIQCYRSRTALYSVSERTTLRRWKLREQSRTRSRRNGIIH